MKGTMKNFKIETWVILKIIDVHRMQVQKLTEISKKIVAMVAMELNNLHDVLANVSIYAANEYSELHIWLKKEKIETERRYKHLDLVVLRALRDFKIGIPNLPPPIDGVKQLFLDNIKKLWSLWSSDCHRKPSIVWYMKWGIPSHSKLLLMAIVSSEPIYKEHCWLADRSSVDWMIEIRHGRDLICERLWNTQTMN